MPSQNLAWPSAVCLSEAVRLSEAVVKLAQLRLKLPEILIDCICIDNAMTSWGLEKLEFLQVF